MSSIKFELGTPMLTSSRLTTEGLDYLVFFFGLTNKKC